MGHIVLTDLGMVAQMERRFIKRQREGIQQAKAHGRYQGGKRRLDRDRIRQLRREGLGPISPSKWVALACRSIVSLAKLSDGFAPQSGRCSRKFTSLKAATAVRLASPR
jgi:DNA invertase Pin-like site-specific DNA recombinase